MLLNKKVSLKYIRYSSGAALFFAFAISFILLAIGAFFFIGLRIFSGSHELNRAVDAGILNATKEALVTPAIALSDKTLPNAANLPYNDFYYFADQSVNGNGLTGSGPAIDLQTYNRCVGQAIIVATNAFAMNNPAAIYHAQLVIEAVQGLGNTLQSRFKTQPPNATFSQLADANTLGMLGSNSTTTLLSNLTPAYVANSNSAANIWLDPSILVGYNAANPTAVINQADFKVPLDTKGLATAPNKSGDPGAPAASTWITGYSPITINIGGLKMTLYTVALQPTASTHLIDHTRFMDSLVPPDANTPPNSFSATATGNVNLELKSSEAVNSNIQAISCAIVGCNNTYNVASIPGGYIRIVNYPSATPPADPFVSNTRYDASNSYFNLGGASKEAITPGCYWVSPYFHYNAEEYIPNLNSNVFIPYYLYNWNVCNNLIVLEEWYDFALSAQLPPASLQGNTAAIAAWATANGMEGGGGPGQGAIYYKTALDPMTLYGTTSIQQEINTGRFPIGPTASAVDPCMKNFNCLLWSTDSQNVNPIDVANTLFPGSAHHLSGSLNLPYSNYGEPLWWEEALLQFYNSPAAQYPGTAPGSGYNLLSYNPPAPVYTWNSSNTDFSQTNVELTPGSSNSQMMRYMGYFPGQPVMNTPDIQAMVNNINNGGPIYTHMIPLVDHYFDGTAPNWMVLLGMDALAQQPIKTATVGSDLPQFSIVRWLKLQVMSLMSANIQNATITMPYGANGIATSGMMNYQRCGLNPDAKGAAAQAYLVHYAEYPAIASMVGNDGVERTNVQASQTIESYGTAAQLMTQIFETLNGPLPVTATSTNNGCNAPYLSNTHTFNSNNPQFVQLMNVLLQRVRQINPAFTMTDLYTALGWNDVAGGATASNFYNTSAPTIPPGSTAYLYQNSSGKLTCAMPQSMNGIPVPFPIVDTGIQPEGVGTQYGEIDVSTGWYAVCGDNSTSSLLNSMVDVDQDGSATASFCGDAGVHTRPYLYEQNSIVQAADQVSFYPAVGMNNLLGEINFVTNMMAVSPDGASHLNSITFNGEN